MHQWGNESVDWAGIDAAAEFIGQGLRRWGRINVNQWKEKYGTVRVYCSLGVSWWPQLTHPGYVYLQWPRRLDFISYPRGWWNPFRWGLWLLNKIAVPYHVWLYRRYYQEARRRWPHLAQEIYRGCDYHELLGARVTNHIIWWPEWDEEPITCEACEAGYRLAVDGLHYDDDGGGWTWGVCRKVSRRKGLIV